MAIMAAEVDAAAPPVDAVVAATDGAADHPRKWTCAASLRLLPNPGTWFPIPCALRATAHLHTHSGLQRVQSLLPKRGELGARKYVYHLVSIFLLQDILPSRRRHEQCPITKRLDHGIRTN